MRSLHVPMTREEWERMPWRFGWKHEYWDGHAHLTPRQDHVHVRVGLRSVPQVTTTVPARLSVRPVSPADARGLVDAFIEAFEDGVEFCDWPAEKIHEHARRNIADYFAGRRGTPLLTVSRLALDEERRVVGAALLIGRDAGATLDLLMVHPGFLRRGIARSLVGAAVEELRARGATILRSAHCVSNEGSAWWHRAFGFEEEPDLNLARLRRAFYAHEVSRHEGLEQAEVRREHARLEFLYELWSRRTEELEEAAGREGFEAVMPSLRYH
ncbi:MAG: GNAT family N-acetyltransferase [Rubrobacter sp.]|nr:GNAT family N-acetyltransferase [Rubrobacter sp.]